MIGVGIIVGVLVFLAVGAMVAELVVHQKEAGLFPGLVAGIWAAWPFIHQGGVQRYNFLHPVPRRYKQPLKHVFAKVRQILSEQTYNFGDKWHVSTADTMQHRITASLRYTEEETKIEGDARGQLHTRKERVQRLIEMDVQFKDEGADTTVVQFDFSPKIEGAAFGACDSIISGITSAAEAALGPGSDAGKPADKTLPAPPWWLLGLTLLSLMTLWGDVMKAVFK
ncbi:MAG: hypothetical protein BWY75_03856 [bacterium ADurb.Bin425]|nr:MAG: hypothetical protein BWY75_03856 [bacterium ADurb.Bin425]